MKYTDEHLRHVLSETRVIACVGASPNPARPSNYVSQFLIRRGYRVIPVNPGQAGRELFGETAVASLSDITGPVDMVDIFQRPERVSVAVEAALENLPGLKFVWMQMGIRNAEAAQKAEAQGVTVIQDRCPKVEIPRLFGAAQLSDFRTGV